MPPQMGGAPWDWGHASLSACGVGTVAGELKRWDFIEQQFAQQRADTSGEQ